MTTDITDLTKTWREAQPQLERALNLAAAAQVSLSIHYVEASNQWRVEVDSPATSEEYHSRDGALNSNLGLLLEHLDRIQPPHFKNQDDLMREHFEHIVSWNQYQLAYIHDTMGWKSSAEYRAFWRDHGTMAFALSNAFLAVNWNALEMDLTKLKSQTVGNVVNSFYRIEMLRVLGMLLRSAEGKVLLYPHGSVIPSIMPDGVDEETLQYWQLGLTSQKLIDWRDAAK